MVEDHEKTADSYHELGVTQYMLRDYTSATDLLKRALKIREKVLVEDHEKTADSYLYLGATQYMLGDYILAAQSLKRTVLKQFNARILSWFETPEKSFFKFLY